MSFTYLDDAPAATTPASTNTPQASGKFTYLDSGDTSGQGKPSAFDYYVKNPAISAGKALVGDAKDIGNALTHPLDIVKGVAQPFVDVAKNPKGNVQQFGKVLTDPAGDASYIGGQASDMIMNHPLQTAAMALPGAEGAAGLVEKGVNAAKNTMSDIGSKNLDNRIFGLYNGAIGAKAKNLGDVTKVQPQRVTALKAMSDNLPNVTLESGEEVPKNRYDLAQTLRQTKQAIWQKVSDLSGGATEAGAQIPMAPIIQKAVNDTIKGIGQDALTANPNLLKSIQQEAMNVSKIGTITPARAQVYMASLNKQLKPVFNGGQAVDYSVLDFKRNLINHLNDATESTIEDTLNKSGYGALRDQYAALKSTEKEIVGAANKYLKQEGGQGGGVSHPIVNLWSIEQGMEAAGHLATGNIPAAGGSLVRAAAVKVASKLADFMKNPDNKIPKMFDLLKKYKSDVGGGVNADESVSPHRTPPNPVDAELVDNSPLGIGQAKPILRNDRLVGGVGNSDGSVINQPGYVAPGLPNNAVGRTGINPNTSMGALPDPGNTAIKQPGFVPRGLPEPLGKTVRVGVNSPGTALPSPNSVAIPMGGQVLDKDALAKTSSPKYGKPNTFSGQLYTRMKSAQDTPIHPKSAAMAKEDQYIREFNPAEKGNPNIRPENVDNFNKMFDFESQQEEGGQKSHGPKDDLTFTKSATSHSPAFKSMSGNSHAAGLKLMAKAANGEKLSDGEKIKLNLAVKTWSQWAKKQGILD